MKILLIEDEKTTRLTLTETLREEGHDVLACADGHEGMDAVRNGEFHVILSDLRLPGPSGIDILGVAKEKDPGCKFVIMTAYASLETAIDALRRGAYDYITKPFYPDELISMIRHIGDYQKVVQENRELRRLIDDSQEDNLIGESPVMQKLKQSIQLIAERDYSVLITGESGSGKELVAREIHRSSDRFDKPFVPVNCAVIPENLLESELFGHEKGAFSGAIKRHRGYFERANGGVLFIDDVDDFPLPLQVKLLRVLQEQEFNRVGGSETIAVNVRILAATKINLMNLVEKKQFREDLFYRLNILPLSLPPLRERKEDVIPLLNTLFRKNGSLMTVAEIHPELLREIMESDWPGNVRQLENAAKRLIAMPDMKTLGLASWSSVRSTETTHEPKESEEVPNFTSHINRVEQELIAHALHRAGRNISDAARLLNIPRSTLRSKMEKLGMLSDQ